MSDSLNSYGMFHPNGPYSLNHDKRKREKQGKQVGGSEGSYRSMRLLGIHNLELQYAINAQLRQKIENISHLLSCTRAWKKVNPNTSRLKITPFEQWPKNVGLARGSEL